ncbi:MAG: hypothetical protein CVU56_03205 [Deltaproteobacteria bacterium HGW-Deltaproteobacteria-14]|nr:MAG: hypothetical protein CVU56_03205 [Deltaproteobacteria bacterium HGW-Deltaproteobacteria-14]
MAIALLWGLISASCSSGPAPATGTDTATADTLVLDVGDGDTSPDVTPTVDTQTGQGACDGLADGAACDDNDACTNNTTCQGGACGGGAPVSCKSNDPCQIASCDAALGCVTTALSDGAACAAPCFTTATCQAGACTGVTPLACPAPTEPCVASLGCDAATGQCTKAVLAPVGTACEGDDDVCTAEACAANGQCSATGAVETCEAQQQTTPCRTWQCSAASGCAESGDVDDGTPCGSLRVCHAGDCVPEGCQVGCGTPLACPTLTAGAAAPESLHYGPVAIVGGASIHLLGGSPSKQHLVYSPGSGWMTGTALSQGVSEGAGVLIGTHWYLVDGDIEEGVRIFDLEAGQWSLGAARPSVASRGPAGGTDGGYFFVAGGGDDSLNATTATHRYDPGADSWTTVAPMPTARGFAAHAVVGDRMYVFGGRDDALSGSSILRATEAYDMATNTWYPLTDMPTKRNSAFAAAVGDHIVVAGGFSGSTTLAVIEIYDTVNDTWETCTTSMSSAFSSGAAASLNGGLYLFGGGSGQLGVEVGQFP